MKLRTWINVITILLLALAVFFGRHQLVQAWGLVGRVDLRIFALMLPVQFLSYYAVGEVMFSYLRAKGNLKSMSRIKMTRIALELNFVNHIIPVPSFAGFSYLGIMLNRHGVSAGRATMAQIIRYAMMFVSFVALIFFSVLALIFDRGVDRTLIVICGSFIIAAIAATALLIYVIGDRPRVISIAKWITNISNKFMLKVTRGKKKNALKGETVERFFIDLHQDYLEIRDDKKILLKPLMWGVLGNILDVALIEIAFLALGFWVNPAVLFIAYGISSFTAIFAATPGGSGVYEAIMIAFMVSAGVPGGAAIAGTLLARVTLFISTVLFGYIFYQLTINKYGKIDPKASL
jgi:uncharacterized protein (TIRG00374 family)